MKVLLIGLIFLLCLVVFAGSLGAESFLGGGGGGHGGGGHGGGGGGGHGGGGGGHGGGGHGGGGHGGGGGYRTIGGGGGYGYGYFPAFWYYSIICSKDIDCPPGSFCENGFCV